MDLSSWSPCEQRDISLWSMHQVCPAAAWQSPYVQPLLLAYLLEIQASLAILTLHLWSLGLKTYIQELETGPCGNTLQETEKYGFLPVTGSTRHQGEGQSNCGAIFNPSSTWEIFKSYYASVSGYSSPSPTLPLGCTNLTLCYLLSCLYKLQTIQWLEHGVRGPESSLTIPGIPLPAALFHWKTQLFSSKS